MYYKTHIDWHNLVTSVLLFPRGPVCDQKSFNLKPGRYPFIPLIFLCYGALKAFSNTISTSTLTVAHLYPWVKVATVGGAGRARPELTNFAR